MVKDETNCPNNPLVTTSCVLLVLKCFKTNNYEFTAFRAYPHDTIVKFSKTVPVNASG